MKRVLVLLIAVMIVLSGFGASASFFKKKTPMDVALQAKDQLLDYWKNEIYADEKLYEGRSGVLDIRSTRVFEIQSKPCDRGKSYKESTNARKYFDDVAYVVEFIVLSDYLMTDPCTFDVSIYDNVIVYKNGKYEVSRSSPFTLYRSRMYESDFTGIIAEVYDLGSELNGAYTLR